MCSNDNVDERISRLVSSSSPVTAVSLSAVQRSLKSNSSPNPTEAKTFDVPIVGSTSLFQQPQQNLYQQYQQQVNSHSSARGTAGQPQHPVANMSSILGGNSVVPPGILPPLDHYRLQLYNYAMAERLRCSQYNSAGGIGGQLQMCAPGYSSAAAAAAAAAVSAGGSPYASSRFALSMSFFHNRVFQPEEPKPQHSYIGLIAMAILNSPESKLVLSDIYQHILDNYPYFRTRGPGWRNSIRHNLSLNDCFIKAGRSANGKGHYWAIHPANLEDFKKGDFRRRKAQRKVRKHMGLAVDDDGTDSSSPPPLSVTPPPPARGQPGLVLGSTAQSAFCAQSWAVAAAAQAQAHVQGPINAVSTVSQQPLGSYLCSQSSRKRQFDVASLLAPDEDDAAIHRSSHSPSISFGDSPQSNRQCGRNTLDRRYNHQLTSSKASVAKRLSLAAIDFDESENEEDIDVVASDAENNNNCNADNTIEDDNPTPIFSYNDDEDGTIGEDLPKEEATDETNIGDAGINQHQQHFQYDQQHQSPTPVALAGEEESAIADGSNDSSPTARAAAAVAAASWHGIIQWPGNFQHLNISPGNMNTRILQRYYGQYMAAAAAQQAAVVAAAATKNRRNNTILENIAEQNNVEHLQKYQQSLPPHHHHQHHQSPSPVQMQNSEQSSPVYKTNDC